MERRKTTVHFLTLVQTSSLLHTSPLEQHIEGVITHGHGLTIYRSFLTMSADSDFAIYCLLSELEKWKQAHDGNFPEAWYNQIYGGSENANQYLLAALEYLVIKRMVQKIVVTRQVISSIVFFCLILSYYFTVFMCTCVGYPSGIHTRILTNVWAYTRGY